MTDEKRKQVVVEIGRDASGVNKKGIQLSNFIFLFFIINIVHLKYQIN